MENAKVQDLLHYSKQTLSTIKSKNDAATLNKIVTINLPYVLTEFKAITGKTIIDLNFISNNKMSRTYLMKVFDYINEIIEKYYLKNENGKYIELYSTPIYRKLVEAISTKDFNGGNVLDGLWPEKVLSDEQGISHIARIMPPEAILPSLTSDQLQKWKATVSGYMLSMNDETADVLDIITSAWLEKAVTSDSMYTIDADSIMRARGIKTRKNSADKRISTFKLEDRQKIANHIHILSNTWINVVEYKIPVADSKKKPLKLVGQSPAIMIDMKFGIENPSNGKLKEFIWRFKPGSVFADYLISNGHSTLLQSQKALSYNYYTQKEEKRLTRFLAWEWGTVPGDTTRRYKVATLLELIHRDIDKKHPNVTLQRIESALDQLQTDSVIKKWCYEKDEDYSNSNYWLNHWLENYVVIEAPDSYIVEIESKFGISQKQDQLYKLLAKPAEDANIDEANLPDNIKFARRFKKKRESSGSSIRDIAKILDISKSTVLRIEQGKISGKLQPKLDEWMKE